MLSDRLCRVRIFNCSFSNKRSPVERALVGEFGKMGGWTGIGGIVGWVLGDGIVWTVGAWLAGNIDGEAVGVAFREVSHGGGEIKTSGEAGFR